MPAIPVASPTFLKPFTCHGVNVSLKDGAEEAVGDCPFCGREGKFYISAKGGKEGQWTCKRCQEGTEAGGGNAFTFLRKLYEVSAQYQDAKGLKALASERRYLTTKPLETWGIVRSYITKEWLVPGYGVDGKLNQLYRYVPADPRKPEGRKILLPTTGVPHQLHTTPTTLLTRTHETIFLCEGPWDAMALWEVIQTDPDLKNRCVIFAAPGCGVFQPSWLPLFTGMRVVILYDNDHPLVNKKTGAVSPPAAHLATKRVTGLLTAADEPPESVSYLHWGENGYDPALVHGTDVRDLLTSGAPAERTLKARQGHLQTLLRMVKPVPEEWTREAGSNKVGAAKTQVKDLPLLECQSWTKLVAAWGKPGAMRWTEGLDRALSVMLACITSTTSVGSQLWVKIQAPPSTGKTSLCEALAVCKKYVVSKSSIRGFHSGYLSDKEGVEDHSLINKLRDRTLVTKDGDVLLQSPNFKLILSEARDIYDRVARPDYRHGKGHDYEGLNMTWILCGTSSLRALDDSELGQRFIDCVIMEGIDTDLEDEILLRVASKAEENMAYQTNGRPEDQYHPDQVKAMRLTGGYVKWLREQGAELIGGVGMDDAAMSKCISLGKFVAYLRARQSKNQDEVVEREFAARLVEQLIRLAKCLAVVLNRDSVDHEVLRRVRRCAIDTSRGRSLEQVRYLHEQGREEGTEIKALAIHVNESENKAYEMIRFLRKIGVTQTYMRTSLNGVGGRLRWRLTEKFETLYNEVMDEQLWMVKGGSHQKVHGKRGP